MKMKRVLACLLAAAMGASLAACGSSGSDEGSNSGGSTELTSSRGVRGPELSAAG